MNGLAFLLGAMGLLVAFLTWAGLSLRRKIHLNSARMHAMAIYHAPGRISLKRLEPFKWNKAARAEPRVAAFRALGFVDAGGFTSGGETPARMFLLRHPGTGHLGIVQERDPAGTWSDVACFQADTSHPIYASSVLNKAHFFLFPGDPKIHLPDASEAELVSAVKKAVENGAPPVSLTPDTAATLIEEAYAAAVDARLQQPLEDFEIRRLLREKRTACEDQEMSDAEFQRIKKQIPFTMGNESRLACRDQFLREGAISAREWHQAKARLLIVHDRTPLHELGGHMQQVAHCRPKLKKRLAATAKQPGTPRAKFAALNAALPPWERYKKLGEVSRPIPADIYCAPLERQSP